MRAAYRNHGIALVVIAVVLTVGIHVTEKADEITEPVYAACEAQNYTGTATVDGNEYDCECWDPSVICEPDPTEYLWDWAITVLLALTLSLIIGAVSLFYRLWHPSGWCPRCEEYHYRDGDAS